MRVTAKGRITLHGAEGATPPLPFVTVDDAEGAGLVAKGYAIEVGQPDPVMPEKKPKNPTIVPKIDPVIEAIFEPAPDPAILALLPPTDDARVAEIGDAIDLLDEEGHEADGDRAGKPKVDAVKEIVGYDVTAEEVDAIHAARAAE